MPELPDVETNRRELEAAVTGRVIEHVDVLYAKSVHATATAFTERVQGRTIEAVRRRGKLLLLDLSGGVHVAIHFKMGGRLRLVPGDTKPDGHTHVVFALDDGRALQFRNPRRFGYCIALTTDELEKMDYYRTLGPEPFDLSQRDFAERVASKRGTVKSVLLDQTVLAGVGNAYSDEALFAAHLHPATPANSLSAGQTKTLYDALLAALQKGLDEAEEHGTRLSIHAAERKKAEGRESFHKVHGKEGSPCPRCGTTIEAKKIGGRTASFCPKCQPL